MTKATKQATVEEYIELVKEGDHDKVVAFIHECFGTDDDFDGAACDAFADEVKPVLEAHLEEQIEAATATPEESAEVVEATMEAANDSGETPESEGEATDTGE